MYRTGLQNWLESVGLSMLSAKREYSVPTTHCLVHCSIGTHEHQPQVLDLKAFAVKRQAIFLLCGKDVSIERKSARHKIR